MVLTFLLPCSKLSASTISPLLNNKWLFKVVNDLRAERSKNLSNSSTSYGSHTKGYSFSTIKNFCPNTLLTTYFLLSNFISNKSSNV